jgi:hypothetical protein
MLNALTPMMPSAAISARPELRLEATASTPELRPSPPVLATGRAEATLEGMVERAARDLFPGREVAVESFYDKGSGRYVHRIADRDSGELLLQTPPDELLRFFASGREPFGKPLLEIDA